jgi:hypothetical protein
MSVFYQSEVVSIDPQGAGIPPIYIPSVQSVSTSTSVARQDVGRMGRFSPSKYRQAPLDPLINFNVEFVPTGYDVEEALGLLGTTSVVDNLVSGDSNYHMVDGKVEISEMVGGGANYGTINMISGVVTNYSFQSSVGDQPRTSFTVEFLDWGFDADTAVVRPTIQEDFLPLRSRDIQLTLPDGIIGLDTTTNSPHVQSFSVNVPLPRTPLVRMGDRKPFSRELQSPIIATFQLSALVNNFENTTAYDGVTPAPSGDTLQQIELVCGTYLNGNIDVDIYQPTCTGNQDFLLMRHHISNPYLDDISYSNSVGGYTTVEMTFSAPVSFDNSTDESNYKISGAA